MSPEEVGAGVVTGGWTYVFVSYAATWAALGGYAVSLWWRGRVVDADTGPGGPP